MKLIILAIGKGRNAAEHQLAEAFISRLPAGGDRHEGDAGVGVPAEARNRRVALGCARRALLARLSSRVQTVDL